MAIIALLLLVTRVMSPSLLMTRTSSVEFDESRDAIFRDPVVAVTESVNCFGVSDPVFDLVIIFLDSENI